MRTAGAALAAAGLAAAPASPLLGLPGAFPVLLGAALVLWFVGLAAAAACLAPPRRAPGLAALGAGVLGWPVVLAYGLSPLWGLLATGAGGGPRHSGRCVSHHPLTATGPASITVASSDQVAQDVIGARLGLLDARDVLR